MKLNKQQNQLLWKIVAEAWIKKDFRDRFLRDPKKVLKKAGLQLAGITLITIVTIQSGIPKIAIEGKILEISLPPAPTELEELDVMTEIDSSNTPLALVCLKMCCC